MADDWTYDLTTAIGRVRLYIPDTADTPSGFRDSELQLFLDANGGDIFAAAADACDVLGNDQARAGKQVSILGISTNGVAVGTYFSQKAETLRARAGTFGMVAGAEWVGVASAAVDVFTDAEIGGGA